jgi:hypothetical protein
VHACVGGIGSSTHWSMLCPPLGGWAGPRGGDGRRVDDDDDDEMMVMLDHIHPGIPAR